MDELKYNVSDEEMTSLIKPLDEMLDEEEPDFYSDLKTAAWNVLHGNPGIDMDEWVQTLMEQYPAEIVDALGTKPEEVFAALADLWGNDYCDPNTGIEQKFSEWAMSFANEYTVGVYYFLVDACADLKKMGRKFPSRCLPIVKKTITLQND